MAWTSADSNRDEYQKALVKLIKDNAPRLAEASDVEIAIRGEWHKKWEVVFNELIDDAHDIAEG